MGGQTHGPDGVQVFVRNLERICADRQELEEQLRITILHETAHFFGLEDESAFRVEIRLRQSRR